LGGDGSYQHWAGEGDKVGLFLLAAKIGFEMVI